MKPQSAYFLHRQTLGERLIFEATSGRAEVVEQLIADGAPVDFANARGVTPLMAAAGRDHSAIVGLLLRKGADVRPADRASGCNALMYACLAGNCQCIQHLLHAGAPLDATDAYGRTALMLAAIVGNVNAVSLLCRAGANTHARDIFGSAALDLASRQGHKTIVALLQSSGGRVKSE